MADAGPNTNGALLHQLCDRPLVWFLPCPLRQATSGIRAYHLWIAEQGGSIPLHSRMPMDRWEHGKHFTYHPGSVALKKRDSTSACNLP